MGVLPEDSEEIPVQVGESMSGPLVVSRPVDQINQDLGTSLTEPLEPKKNMI